MIKLDVLVAPADKLRIVPVRPDKVRHAHLARAGRQEPLRVKMAWSVINTAHWDHIDVVEHEISGRPVIEGSHGGDIAAQSEVELIIAPFRPHRSRNPKSRSRVLAALAEHEIAERSRRRLERHLAEARLPLGKTLDSFDFEAVPVVSKAQVMALAAGDAWLNNGANLLLFGPPGGGKSHLAAALGFALVENGWRVLFTRTTDLVQRLQIARRELALEAAIAKLDKFHLLILDDIAYVTKDQAETSVLFELISARYERRSLLITANQPFGEWGKIFPDQAMTVAVVDRLVHHATIFEMNVESYRRRAALERKRGRGRPPAHATITANA